jgi:anthranilate phosphoribosyltransferase
MIVAEILHQTVQLFKSGDELPASSGETFLDSLISETDESLLINLFTAWNVKGITENEIYTLAKIMRDRCSKVISKHANCVDIVGTGGSKLKSFNISTAAAFVVAGEDIPVAKHGNRAATSSSGSADVLSALGIEPAVDAAAAERCLNEIGMCFMYAPNFHRLSPTLARVRRGLGFPTIFNCVGPLCNPATAPHQLIGVWERGMVRKIANALARLGTTKSWVVHGEDGSDEISISGPTYVAEIVENDISEFEFAPADLGLQAAPLDEYRIASPEQSAALIRSVLASELAGTAAENVVVINAVAASYLSSGGSFAGHLEQAVASIRGGQAAAKLEALAQAVSK